MFGYWLILLRWRYYGWKAKKLLQILDRRSARAYRTSDPKELKAYEQWLERHERKMDLANNWFGFYTYLRRTPHLLTKEVTRSFFQDAHFEELRWLARKLGVLYYRDEEHLLEQVADRQRMLAERTWQFTLMIMAVVFTALATRMCS